MADSWIVAHRSSSEHFYQDGKSGTVFIPQKETDPQLRTNKLQEAAEK